MKSRMTIRMTSRIHIRRTSRTRICIRTSRTNHRRTSRMKIRIPIHKIRFHIFHTFYQPPKRVCIYYERNY
jgi:hypothetical protein